MMDDRLDKSFMDTTGTVGSVLDGEPISKSCNNETWNRSRPTSRRHECTQVAKLSTSPQHQPPVGQKLIQEVLLFVALEVRTELLLDSAATRGTSGGECVGIIRHLSTTVFWLQQLVNRGMVTAGACTSAENRADLGTKAPHVHRLRQLRPWSGLVLDRK